MGDLFHLSQPEPEPALFDEWWSLQFHKTEKPLCKVKFDAITSPRGYHTRMMDKTTGEYVEIHLQATPEEILEAQKRQNKAFFERHGYANEHEKQFMRRPKQWLNQGGWLDE